MFRMLNIFNIVLFSRKVLVNEEIDVLQCRENDLQKGKLIWYK